MKEGILRCALYIRVSSDEQAKYGDSLRDQKERGIEYIEQHKNMILQDIYIDDGVSGQKLDRDDFSRLIDAVCNDNVDLILFTKLDRWFRNLRHYLNTQSTLDKHQVAWTAIDQPYFDTSSPHGQAFVAQSMMWAELEAKNDGIRIRDVFKNKVKNGEAITGKTPRWLKIYNKHYILSEDAPAIYDSVQYFLKTQSLHASVKYLNEKYGINMTINNFKQSILRNQKITGKYRDNEKYCPRLISDEDYNKITQIIENNQVICAKQQYDYIFSGLMVCNECGYKMTSCHINVISKRKSGKIYKYRYPAYKCAQNSVYKRCSNGGETRELRIEEYLLANIRKVLENYIAEYESHNIASVDNRTRKANIRKKIERLKDLYLNEAITLDEYKIDRAKFEQQLDELPDVIESPKDMSGIKKFLNSDFESVYSQLNNLEKRRFWRGMIKEIRLSKSHERQRRYEIIPL